MRQIKVALTLVGITAAAFSLAACQIVYSPMAGTTFNETKYGNIATDESVATKRGEPAVHRFWGGLPRVMLVSLRPKPMVESRKSRQWTIMPRISWGSSANGARSSRAADSGTSTIEGAFGVEAPEALLFWSALLTNAV